MACTKATHRRSQVRRRQREAQRVALAPQGRAIAGNSNGKNKNIDSITSMNTPRAIDHCSESQTRLALSANASNASPAGNVHATVPSLAKVILSRQSLSDQAELTTAHPLRGQTSQALTMSKTSQIQTSWA